MNLKSFYCDNKETYPPFKNGSYLEEYFYQKYSTDNPTTKRKYIPALWTNFQIETWFKNKKNEMQKELDKWVSLNPSENGYFTVVQYDDGVLLKLPKNTIVYGACSGDIQIPLIYEDNKFTLEHITPKKFNDKSILCSFVGCLTGNHIKPNVREIMFNKLKNNKLYKLNCPGGWTPKVTKNNQDNFIKTTINSKFALAPRGYGRNSFRFYEVLKLGTIPIYLWNDIEWLPYKDKIDYNKLCISLHISNIDKLDDILLNITEDQYNKMLKYYEEIKNMFYLDGMYNYIVNSV